MSTCWMCTVWVVNVNTINSVNNELIADMKQFESTEYSPRLLIYSSLAKLDIQITDCPILPTIGDTEKGCPVVRYERFLEWVFKEVIKRSLTLLKWKLLHDLRATAMKHVFEEREGGWSVAEIMHLFLYDTAKIYIFLLPVSTACLKLREHVNLEAPAGVSTEGEVFWPWSEKMKILKRTCFRLAYMDFTFLLAYM